MSASILILHATAAAMKAMHTPRTTGALRYTTVRGISVRAARTRMAAYEGLGREDICVLGGGFGGLYTALKLSKLDWGTCKPRITLVDKHDRFAFLPMMYELTTGSVSCWEVAPMFEEVLNGSGVQFLQGDVQRLDRESKLITVATGDECSRQLPYNQCVLALGSEVSYAGVAGAREHSFPFYTLDDALQLREALLTRRLGAAPVRVVVVGGSYIGVELAANLREWLGDKVDLTLVHRSDSLLSNSEEHNRRVGTQRLRSSGVKVLLDSSVARVTEDGVALSANGAEQQLSADIVVWTAGSKPSGLAASLGVEVDAKGRVVVDSALRVCGCDDVHALGDVASINDASGASVPSTAQSAMQQAEYAAWNVRAALRGERPLAFRYANLGEMLSLGGAEASLSSLGVFNFEGPVASAARRAVYAARMPTASQASRVGLSWAVDAVLAAAKKASETMRS
uniref:FAD/NAD(P)-binding domain-containing protein n=1 Tax=Chrysotila carterae TaxID=13221 RepID=A0A7S4BRY4_CHRCT